MDVVNLEFEEIFIVLLFAPKAQGLSPFPFKKNDTYLRENGCCFCPFKDFDFNKPSRAPTSWNHCTTSLLKSTL